MDLRKYKLNLTWIEIFRIGI